MEDKYEKIEQYLMNELSIREQVKFEEDLRKDPELRREYELRKEINDAIQEDDVMELRDSLDQVMKKQPVFSNKTRKIYLISSVAAALVVILVISSKVFFSAGSQKSSALYERYYEVYPVIMSFRSTNEGAEEKDLLYKAFASYDIKDYNQASQYFESIAQQDSTNYLSRFYLSICKIETNKLNEAEDYLSELTVKNNHIFWEQAHWYLAMVYVKKDKQNKAREILHKIVQQNMAKKKEAKDILKSMK
ncbi:MAG: tetratricopeptide repeat protein [Bacteroidetes bacterium]|nr:tetratricopeptide repeat protein [Bacteroidota bacterium]